MRNVVAVSVLALAAACSGSSGGTTTGGSCALVGQSCSASTPCCGGLMCSVGECVAAFGTNEGASDTTGTVGTTGTSGTHGTSASGTTGTTGLITTTTSGVSSGASGSTGTATSGTSGTTSSSGSLPDGGTPPPTCSLTQSGDLNIDIESVTISGTITVNHATPPAGLNSTYITFGGGTGWSLSRGNTYTVTLLAGTYDIGVETSDNQLTSFVSGQSAVLVAHQSLTQSGSLNLDIETVQISGNVTVNHAAPSGLNSTSLTFNGDYAPGNFGSTYAVTLLAGTYDIGVTTQDSQLTSLYSGQSAVILAGQALTQSGSLNLDIESVQISGNVTVNHAAPSGLSSSNLTFNGSPLQSTLGSTYSVTLLAGTYDIGVTTQDSQLTSLGSQSGVILAGQALTQSGSLNLDVESVQISGNVTVNHGAPPAGLSSTALTFNGVSPTQALSSTYAVTLLAGAYDIGVTTQDSQLTSFNGQSATLLSGQQLTQSGSLNLDIESIQLSGNVTVNHAAPSGLNNTNLTFNGDYLPGSFGSTFSATMLAGTYDIGVNTSDTVLTTLSSGESMEVLSGVQLTQSGALDIDIDSVQLAGSVTVNHAAPPSLPSTSLEFNGGPPSGSFGASYSVTLVSGAYAIEVQTDDAPLTTLQGGQTQTLPVCP